MSFNKIIIVGNLGRDPELRYAVYWHKGRRSFTRDISNHDYKST